MRPLPHRISTPGQPGSRRSLVFADGFLWVARARQRPRDEDRPGREQDRPQIPLHGWISDLAVGGGWSGRRSSQDGQIYKLSEDDLSVAGARADGPDPERISIGGGRVWVANAAAKTVSLIDLASGARARASPARAEPTTVAYHDGLVWAGAAPAAAAAAHPRPGAPNLDAVDRAHIPTRRMPGVERAVPVRDLREPAQLSGLGRTGRSTAPPRDRGGDADRLDATAAPTPSASAAASASRLPRTSR